MEASALEQISGVNNWKLVIRREAAGVAILRAETCDRKAALPEELFGLPVTVLGHHALTPGHQPPEGEEVLMTCGPAGEEWDNRQLEDLRLPETLRRVGDYALFNCTARRTLRLADTVSYWGGGVLMNCRQLDTFHLACTGREGELMDYLAGELPRELDMTLSYSEGRTARVIFPEYAEVFEENVPHHQFDFHIQGAGYPYHHCFYHKQFSLRDYDQLWKGYLGMEYEPDCALRLAWWRLRYPMDLTDQAEAAYWAYLRDHGVDAARWLLSRRDAAGLRTLFSRTDCTREDLSELCDLARRQDATEVLAVLLEEQHKRFPSGMDKTFDL